MMNEQSEKQRKRKSDSVNFCCSSFSQFTLMKFTQQKYKSVFYLLIEIGPKGIFRYYLSTHPRKLAEYGLTVSFLKLNSHCTTMIVFHCQKVNRNTSFLVLVVIFTVYFPSPLQFHSFSFLPERFFHVT